MKFWRYSSAILCVVLCFFAPLMSLGQNLPPMAILANAAKVQANGKINFCGFYLGMPEADVKTLAAYYGLDAKQWSYEATPLTRRVFILKFSLQSVRRLTKGGNTLDDLVQAVANRLGRMEPILDSDEKGYCYKNIDYQHAAITEIGLVLFDVNMNITAGKEKKEIDRKRSEKTVEALEKAAKGAVAKLANDMVPIPDKDYSMCKYEVSQALWFAVMGNDPAEFKEADNPVEHVSRKDCRDFIEKLNVLPEVQRAGLVYRLPTGYEWEYACLAGAKGDYGKLSDGSEITAAMLDEVAWFKVNSNGKTQPVGQKKPNAFGLYDMLGNVSELTSSSDTDFSPLCCGGNWMSDKDDCVAYNRRIMLDYYDNYIGFRLVCTTESDRRAVMERNEMVRNAIREASKIAVGKLENDMVRIPGMQFAVCKYEVTQPLWFAVMGVNPAKIKGVNLPIYGVSMSEVKVFIEKLNALPEVKESGRTYRLPTDEEWVFAARAGANGQYCLLDDNTEITEKTLIKVGWFKWNSDEDLHAVGQKRPNAFGLYDMYGNVSELTSSSEEHRFGGSYCTDHQIQFKPLHGASDGPLGLRLVCTTEDDRRTVIENLASDMIPIPEGNYALGKFEVTQSLWLAIMGNNPSRHTGKTLPVENISWDDCQMFLAKLNALPEVRAKGVTYRLPTLDEWKFACLAGTKGPFCKLADGSEITLGTLDEVAWYEDNGDGNTHPVGKRLPNAFGLYDMLGNVCEWTTASDGSHRIYCGGACRSQADKCETINWRSTFRSTRSDDIGFRLAADLPERKAERNRKMVSKLALDMVPIPGRKYSMCKFEVTRELWLLVMGDNPPWRLVKGNNPIKEADLPVAEVSLIDCLAFLEKLNALPEVRESGLVFRLPTTDEWVFACRAGSKGNYCCLTDGTEITRDRIGEVAWHCDNSNGKTHPIGQKKPNAFGLYDMLGNVEEWTSSGEDAQGVGCGGAFNDYSFGQNHYSSDSDVRDLSVGFRLAANVLLQGEEKRSETAERGDAKRKVVVNNTERKNVAMKAERWEATAEAEQKAAERAEAEQKAAERAEAERKAAAERAEAERKRLAEVASREVAKLAADMIPIPGKDYAICKYEVTQLLWEAVMGKNPAQNIGADLPVENVSWIDCQKFIETLNSMPEVKNSGFTYRLPTADEWEFACLAGAVVDYCKIADGTEITWNILDEVAWYSDNGNGKTHPVGQKKPNAFGLFDMHGNVGEWTSSERENGRVDCGGSWYTDATHCGARDRHVSNTNHRYADVGLRLAR